MLRRLTFPLALVLASLAAAPAAHAGVFGDEQIDAGVELRQVGDLDLARDGTGAVAYIKLEGGVPHVFVARFEEGIFQVPQRIDTGLDVPASDPAVAAGDGGRMAVFFSSGGTVYGVIRAAAGQPFSAPVPIGSGQNPSADMSINGAAYAAYVNGTDVQVVRVDRKANTFTLLGAPADADPTAVAGIGVRRPRVSVSADGVGLITWGEDGADGVHVWARKAFGLNLSVRPQDLGLGDTPDVDAEDDSSFAWVAFRRTLDGRSQVVARRQRGTEFDEPVLVDTGDENADLPRVGLNGRGDGIVASSGTASRQPINALVNNDVFLPPNRLGGPGTTIPNAVPTYAENNDGFVFWVQSGEVRFRPYDGVRSGPEGVLGQNADPSLGFDAATDRANSALAVWMSGTGADRRLLAGLVDRPPLSFRGTTTTNYRRFSRPPLRWVAAFDLWGPLTYTVFIDEQEVGKTNTNEFTVPNPVGDGEHTWKVVATDRRGQSITAPTRPLRIDASPPTLTVSVRRRRSGASIAWRAADIANPTGSGVRRVRIDFGDGSPPVAFGQRGTILHRYARTSILRVSATDRAGNATVVSQRVQRSRRR